MRKKRAVNFLKQRSYLIAAVIMLAAAFGMTGVYFAQQSKDQKQKQEEIAAKEKLQNELAEADEEELDDDIDKAESVSSIISPNENDDFMDSPSYITENGIENNAFEDDRIVGSIKEKTEAEEKLAEEEEAAESEKEALEEASAIANTPELHFSAETDLNWPIQGNVILNYSMDQTVYFATLDQYKYNPAIIIQAQVNEKVLSVANGLVSSIVTDEVTGHTVTIDLGDGFSAVYGQMKEIPVQEGQYIQEGDIVGYVNEPTKYFSVEGSNIYFQLLKDGADVNPMEYLN